VGGDLLPIDAVEQRGLRREEHKLEAMVCGQADVVLGADGVTLEERLVRCPGALAGSDHISISGSAVRFAREHTSLEPCPGRNTINLTLTANRGNSAVARRQSSPLPGTGSSNPASSSRESASRANSTA
jgi:hypothetical protein